MKCQKCGQNEVRFFYSTNVNGEMSETHLCASCAFGVGNDIMNLLHFSKMMEEVTPVLGANRYYMPVRRKVTKGESATDATCSCENANDSRGEGGIDEVMTERRELNMQMRVAIESEDFEKAAELRDKIKQLEVI